MLIKLFKMLVIDLEYKSVVKAWFKSVWNDHQSLGFRSLALVVCRDWNLYRMDGA